MSDSGTAMSWGDFIEKLDWEGGVIDMLSWGGVECFPVEAQPLARQIDEGLKALDEMIEYYG